MTTQTYCHREIFKTHLSYAETDLIEIEKDINNLKEFAEVLTENVGFKMGILEEHRKDNPFKTTIEAFQNILQQKQLRKSQIEENIKLLRENLK